MPLPSAGGDQQTVCLHLDFVPMWLATIQTGRVREDLRAKLGTYQREAARVLRDHFLGPQRGKAHDDTSTVDRLNRACVPDPVLASAHQRTSALIGELVAEVLQGQDDYRSRMWIKEKFSERGHDFTADHISYVLHEMLSAGRLRADKSGWALPKRGSGLDDLECAAFDEMRMASEPLTHTRLSAQLRARGWRFTGEALTAALEKLVEDGHLRFERIGYVLAETLSRKAVAQ